MPKVNRLEETSQSLAGRNPYHIAVFSTALALGLRVALHPFMGEFSPFSTFYIAVVISAWAGGWKPGMLSTALSVMANVGLMTWLSGWGVFNGIFVIELVSFLFVSALISSLSEAFHSQRRRATATLAESEHGRQALVESEAKFRAVAEMATSAIYIHDGAHLVFVNAAAEEITGYSREDLIASDMWSLVHPEFRDKVKAYAQARFRGEDVPDRYEYKIVTKAGEEKWLDFSARVVEFEGKRCILANAFDTTERKKAEEALRESDEHLRLALEAASMCSWDWNMHTGKETFIGNQQAIFGVGPEERKTFASFLQMVHPEDRRLVEENIARASREDQMYRDEFRVIWPDGSVHWIRGQGKFFYDESGLPMRMIGVNMDLTERMRSEEALRKTEKLAATGRLAATIAHEINNPLEAVTNLIYLARSDGKNMRHYLDLADQELRRVAHITKQTLGFYRDTAAPNAANPGTVIDEVVKLFQKRILTKGVALEVKCGNVPEIEVYQGEFRQILSNLITNATDATSKGGRIVVRCSTVTLNGSEPMVRISVADTGSGMSEAVRKHIFEPFFTTKKDVGTGLGLWLTSSLVEKHGAKIKVRSSTRPGRSGTVFSLFMRRKLARPDVQMERKTA